MSDFRIEETPWRVDDMALAMHTLPPSGVTAGRFLTVAAVVQGSRELGLLFREVECPKAYLAFAAAAFLKVTPPRDLIEQERREQAPVELIAYGYGEPWQ